jgi:hypothetical protein
MAALGELVQELVVVAAVRALLVQMLQVALLLLAVTAVLALRLLSVAHQ